MLRSLNETSSHVYLRHNHTRSFDTTVSYSGWRVNELLVRGEQSVLFNDVFTCQYCIALVADE